MMRIPYNELAYMASDKYKCTAAERYAFCELLALRQAQDAKRSGKDADAITRAEKDIGLAIEALTQALKESFVGVTVEARAGRHLVYCKAIDAEDGKLVLDNGTRRERRNVEPVVICDRQDEARRHEVETKEAVS